VMIRKSERQSYKKALILTPRLNADHIFFTNGKSARVVKIEQNEDTLQPFLWITLESKPAKKRRELRARWTEAGIK